MNVKHTAILIAGLLLCLKFIPTNLNAQGKTAEQETKSPFISKWKLDTTKTDLGSMPKKYAFHHIEIKQGKDSITIIRQSEDLVATGIKATIQTLPLDGNLSPYRSDIMKRTKFSSIAIASGGFSMTETAYFKYDETPIDGHQTRYIETWNLDSTGRELTIVREMKMNNEKLDWSTTCVYEKE